MRTHAQEQVAMAVTNEIRRLWSMVEQFEAGVPFQEEDTGAYKMVSVCQRELSMIPTTLTACPERTRAVIREMSTCRNFNVSDGFN